MLYSGDRRTAQNPATAMSITQQNIDALGQEVNRIVKEADAYFDRVAYSVDTHPVGKIDADHITQADREGFVPKLSAELNSSVLKIMEASRESPLISEVDCKGLRVALRRMLAALRIHRYHQWEVNVVADEDRVLGVEPAGQAENPCSVADARRDFHEAAASARRVLELIFPSNTPIATALAKTQTAEIMRYRPNTAFIMMWISKDRPELEDVKDTIKEVFKRYGIKAVRSDEIEHSGTITERVLHEIATSEFLVADLTGERPSVYYEVGYAHALGKRPILYRRAGTHLHFDLSVHNCPEYANLADLRKQLVKRLSDITNKTAVAATDSEAESVVEALERSEKQEETSRELGLGTLDEPDF